MTVYLGNYPLADIRRVVLPKTESLWCDRLDALVVG
jgi:hypothetical protein